MDNIITLDFSQSREIIAPGRYQYDYGQEISIEGIDLPESFEVHFANKYDAEVAIIEGDSSSIKIPDENLRRGTDVIIWIFVHNEETDGRTVYKAIIPVIRRPEPILT